MNWFQKMFANTPNHKKSTGPPTTQTNCEAMDFDDAHFCGTSILCDAHLLKGKFSLNEIADFVRKNRDAYPNAQLFASLDHPAQAAYTSFHSTQKHELDSLDGHDQASLPNNAFEQFEDERMFIGYFPFRHANFMKGQVNHASQSMKNQLGWVGLDQYYATVRTRATITDLDRDEQSLVQVVPVQHPAEALAAFPNGYFTDDLDPFENYVLARELYDHFELSLFGVGATYLGFMADAPLDDASAVRVAEFLAQCIEGYIDKPPLGELLRDLIKGQTEVYIAYGRDD